MFTSSVTDNINQTVSSTAYTYDKVGNRTKVVTNDTITDYTYNELNQVKTAVVYGKDDNVVESQLAYIYDLSGNQISQSDSVTGEVITNEYDTINQLTRSVMIKSGVTQYTQTNTYNYDGQRISKTDNGVTTYYYYQGAVLLYTTEADGNKTSQNIVGPQENIIATIRYEEDGQAAYFYNKDIRTSITNVVDDAGHGVVSYKYDDYGTTTKYGSQDFYNEICYTSGVYDELTSLYYLNARYYNPSAAMFMTQDSYRGEQNDYGTWNMYAYCGGNPINYVDPSGHILRTIYAGYYAGKILWNCLRHYISQNGKYSNLSNEQKLFVAVIAGEAIGENEKSWRAIAHIIMNRVNDKKREFKKDKSVTDVIKHSAQFSSYQSKSGEYTKAKKYLEKRKPKNDRYEKLIKTVIPIYNGQKKDITKGSLLFYSPVSMTPPGSKPDWDYGKLQEIEIKGISSNKFRFFRYR